MPRYRVSDLITRLLFRTNPPDYPHREGLVDWSNSQHTINIDSDISDVVGQATREILIKVRNVTGAPIGDGKPVYITGVAGNRPTVALAKADFPITSHVLGFTTSPINDNDDGYVCVDGLVNKVNTGALAEAAIYLSATTAGGISNAVPAAPNFVVDLGEVLVSSVGNGVIRVNTPIRNAFGSVLAGNYTQFEGDGTMRALGLATCYRDELQSLISTTLTSPSGDFVLNAAECSITAKTSARYPSDYLSTNLQINHDWSPGTAIFPHLHWWQTTANTPNWLIEYRWQKQGSTKTTAWTPIKWSSNAFVWAAGTLNQITIFSSIAAPAGYGQVSDIVQFKIYRDYTDVSGLFLAGDPVNASQDLVNFDTHIQVDTLGSRQEYIK